MAGNKRLRKFARFDDEDDQAASSSSGGCVASVRGRLRSWRNLVCSHRRHAIVLACCLLVKLLKSPGQNNVMGSSVPFILDDLALDDLTFANSFAIGTATASLFQPFFGALLDVRGLRFCMPLGVLGLGAGLLLLSFATGPSIVTLSFVLIRATSIGCLDAWTAAAISLWFSTYRGVSHRAVELRAAPQVHRARFDLSVRSAQWL